MIKRHKPDNRLKRLCSIDVEAPTQLDRDDRFGLVVASWFNTTQEKIDDQTLTFGLTSARIDVDTCDNSSIALGRRYEKIAYTVQYDLNDTKSSERSGKAGGFLGMDLPDWLHLFKGKVEAGGEFSGAISRSQSGQGTYTAEIKSIWECSANGWRLAAVAPHSAQAVLNERMLGDEPLCDIKTDTGAAEVDISLVATLSDVWVEPARPVAKGGILDADTQNRMAIYRVLYAAALKCHGSLDDPQGEVTLASVHVSRTIEDAG